VMVRAFPEVLIGVVMVFGVVGAGGICVAGRYGGGIGCSQAAMLYIVMVHIVVVRVRVLGGFVLDRFVMHRFIVVRLLLRNCPVVLLRLGFLD
ncbi:MAG: hypothetical protein ACLGIS_17600, partial [Actinomycetes bacterium]